MSSLSYIDSGSRLGIRPSSTESCRPPPSSAHQSHRRQRSLPSLRKATLTAPVTPSNASEWKNAIDEVKQKYSARKYRSCSVQCCEILDNLKDTSAIEPLHLIYLHFYAASSFEWCARPLSTSSTYRAELLCDAQTHYTEAEALITAAEWNIAEKARSLSWASTTSLGSPSLSASSRTPESNSTVSSPRTSGFFLDDESFVRPTRPVRVKPKKKVSFSSLPEFFEFQPEPYIRPDSPTLGWEEHVSMSPHEMDSPFPISPKKHSPTSIIKLPLEEKVGASRIVTTEIKSKIVSRNGARTTTMGIPQSAHRNTVDQEHSRERSTPNNHTFDLESFLQTRTLNRFREQLSALRDQVCRHRAAVDGLLTTSNDAPTTPTSANQLDMFPVAQQFHLSYAKSHMRHQSTPGHIGLANNPSRPVLRIQTDIGNYAIGGYRHLRGYGPASAGLAQYSTPVSAYSPTTPTSAILSPLSAGGDEKSLQDRIERLRASGWRRKRFDNRRYEALREQVLGELSPYC
ncbi:hypothetical protein GQX73_g4847 [Xylaria multiplex]|uniref:Uncharacterized protein n=1 Tax=Xylaria multiplex TaxID=323545 RepID=A0A7C8IP82_9PEZI|nr:hypothetical protein GQX73_g4847 [Xylaria multiplex]